MWGKLLFAMLAAVVAMVAGVGVVWVAIAAIFGAAIGHFVFDRDDLEPNDVLLPTEAYDPKTELIDGLMQLLVEIARSDGGVSDREWNEINRILDAFVVSNTTEVGTALRGASFDAAVSSPTQQVSALAKMLRSHLSVDERYWLMRQLFALAAVDGDVARSESDGLKQVAQAFHLADERMRAISEKFLGEQDRLLHRLELTPEATDDEIKSAYRRLAKIHHPDTLGDDSEDQKRLAQERFQHINEAYALLKKIRGL